MLKFIFQSKPLVEKTPLSMFVREASSGEKKRVYIRVISQATAEQKEVLEAAASKRKLHPSHV
jgi:hypothetical protein